MKRMEVTILGQTYVLSCPDGGEQSLLEAATKVDREMCAIRDAGRIKARERIAVLAALNLAYANTEQADEPVPTAATAPSVPAGDSSALPAGVDALIARIDETLAHDGRLL